MFEGPINEHLLRFEHVVHVLLLEVLLQAVLVLPVLIGIIASEFFDLLIAAHILSLECPSQILGRNIDTREERQRGRQVLTWRYVAEVCLPFLLRGDLLFDFIEQIAVALVRLLDASLLRTQGRLYGVLRRILDLFQPFVVVLLPPPHHRVELASANRRLVGQRIVALPFLRVGNLRTLRVQPHHLPVELLESVTRQFVGQLLLVTAVALVHRPVVVRADLQRTRFALVFRIEVRRCFGSELRDFRLLVYTALTPEEVVCFDLANIIRQVFFTGNFVLIHPFAIVSERRVRSAHDRAVVVVMVDRRAHVVHVIE